MLETVIFLVKNFFRKEKIKPMYNPYYINLCKQLSKIDYIIKDVWRYPFLSIYTYWRRKVIVNKLLDYERKHDFLQKHENCLMLFNDLKIAQEIVEINLVTIKQLKMALKIQELRNYFFERHLNYSLSIVDTRVNYNSGFLKTILNFLLKCYNNLNKYFYET